MVDIFSDGSGDTEWVVAGLAASVVLGSGVVLREVVLRNARERYIAAGNRLDLNVRAPSISGEHRMGPKLTLERNAAALENIKRKSEAAKVFGRLSAGHKEVFVLCEEYIRMVSSEIPNVHPASPRLKALTTGHDTAAKIHRHHLLRWSEIEAKELSGAAQNAVTFNERIGNAQKAKGAIDYALGYYPDDKNLLESALLMDELILSIKVSDLIEQAERASFKGQTKLAADLYKDALYYLRRNGISTEQQAAVGQIEAALIELENAD